MIRDFVRKNKIPIHLSLFLITLFTTLIAGMEWVTGKEGPYDISDLHLAVPYSLSILFILTCHEFGHYFAAKYHKVKTTLPFYIPFPPIPGFLNFGTMGAVIKTKQIVPDNKSMFDIGVYGPIGGFIATLIVLIIGFTNVPDINYLLNIHPDYLSPEYAKNTITFAFGDNLLFVIFKKIFIKEGMFFPPMSEIYHYPYLCVGWFGLFITSMNMIPVGQLDGGHVIFGMFGNKIHNNIAHISMILLFILGIMGILEAFLPINIHVGWSGWLMWALILYFIIKVKHPQVFTFEKLDRKRMIIGYIAIAILVLSFTPTPFIIGL